MESVSNWAGSKNIKIFVVMRMLISQGTPQVIIKMTLSKLIFITLILSSISSLKAEKYKVTKIIKYEDSGISLKPFMSVVNDSGLILGHRRINNSTPSIFYGPSLSAILYRKNEQVTLGSFGGLFSYAKDINNRNNAVGRSERPDGVVRAAYFGQNSTSIFDLGTLDDSDLTSGSEANGINDNGVIVGSDHKLSRAMLFSGTGKGNTDLGGFYSKALAINSSGLIVGYSHDVDGYNKRATLFQKNGNIDLGTLVGGNYSEANAINSSGLIVGSSNFYKPSRFSNWPSHAVIFRPGAPVQDLGSLGGNLSEALDVNDSGVIVGRSEVQTEYFQHSFSDSRAFVYRNGVMNDLNKLVINYDNIEIENAVSINNSGQIVALGKEDTIGGTYIYSLLLTPFNPIYRVAAIIQGNGKVLGNGSYKEGRRVTLLAKPEPGNVFVEWRFFSLGKRMISKKAKYSFVADFEFLHYRPTAVFRKNDR